MLGILQSDPEDYLKAGTGQSTELPAAKVEELIAARNVARRSRNWAAADQIRDQLISAGIVLEDGVAGTTWRRQ